MTSDHRILRTEMTHRNLTTGETALARRVFGSSIDYAKVRVHDRGYVFFQPNNSGMTPNGELYMKGVYNSDYASQSAYRRAFFIHEMVHVWQFQLRVLSPVGAAIGEMIHHVGSYDQAYRYLLVKDKDLLDYKIEQQAAMIEDFARIKILNIPLGRGQMQNQPAHGIPLLMKTLAKFVSNPGYARRSRCNISYWGGGLKKC